MATETWVTRVRNDTDATHREWRDELLTKLNLLVAAGVLAADETNFVAGVGSRPAASNIDTKYAVFHLNDSLHATAPIYFRFTVGSGSSFQPHIYFTVGTSTNGSGVLGGTALSVNTIANNNATQTSDTVRNSYMCALPGFFGLVWKLGASNTEAFFQISRTVDAAGAPTATGAIVTWGSGSQSAVTKVQAFGFSPAVAYTATTSVGETALGFNPQCPTSTIVGANTQAFVGWMPTPAMAPIVGVCGVLPNEQTSGNTFTATLVGSTTRTYLSCGLLCGPFGPIANSATGGLKYAMLWE